MKKKSKTRLSTALCPSSLSETFLDEESFKRIIIHERTRAERTLTQISIITVDFAPMIDSVSSNEELERKFITFFKEAIKSLSGTIRVTDSTGWFIHLECLGILFTDLSSGCEQILVSKIEKLFNVPECFTNRELSIQISVFPLVTAGENPGILKTFYPEIKSLRNRINAGVKRCIDIVGCLSAFITFSPLFIILMVLIKITSPGPIFYCQQRVGKDGKNFVMYKFRSMRTGVNDSIHREYVTKLIQGDLEENQTTYKIVADPRVTSIGYFLRKTSLDEIPQFLNVLIGNMSLVGPRPPIYYETKQYKPWHLKRIFEAKPGITGIWQIEGRSAINFDGMVRMDLQYIKHCSTIIDIKLILKTFFVFFTTKGAY